MLKIIITFMFSVLAVSVVSADDFIDIVNKGNKAFAKKKYSEALDYYQSAEPKLSQKAELEYNLAGALNQKADYEKAVESYKKALQTTDLNLEAQAQYNLGNTYYKMGDYQNAITSYQNSLMINPEDLDAKYNLELARKMLKEQMKNQKNKPDQQKQNQDKKDKDKQEQQNGEQDKQGDQNKQQNQQGDQKNKQDQQKQNKDNKDKDGKDKKGKSEAQKKKEAEQKKQEERKRKEAAGKIMSKEDAERILNGIKDDEAKQQKRLRRVVNSQDEYKGNDW